jgi:cell division septum initiation protein DivIVA
MSVYNKEELMNLLEGIQEELEELDQLLQNRNNALTKDIMLHERTLDHLEGAIASCENRCLNIQTETDYVQPYMKGPVSFKLELGS